MAEGIWEGKRLCEEGMLGRERGGALLFINMPYLMQVIRLLASVSAATMVR